MEKNIYQMNIQLKLMIIFFFIRQAKGIKILKKIIRFKNIRFNKSFENNLCHFHFIYEK